MTSQLDLAGTTTEVRATVSDGILVECDNRQLLDALRARLRYPNPAYQNARRLGLFALPDQYVRNYREEGGVLRIPRGASPALREVCGEFRARVRYADQRLSVPVEFPPLSGRKEPTPLQERSIAALLKRENAYVQASTGAGKTLLVLETIRRAGQRALFMAPNSGLVDQTIREADDLIAPGVAGKLAGKPHALRKIMVTTYAMLASIQRLNPEWWEVLRLSYGLVVVDELHLAASATVSRTLDLLPARYRFGVSATVRRKDSMEFKIFDLLSQAADVITIDEAVDAGRIVHAAIEVVPTGVRDPEVEALRARQRSKSARDRLKGTELRELSALAIGTVSTSAERASLVGRDVAADVAAGRSCLVLARSLDHVDALAAAIRAEGVDTVEILKGGDNKEYAQAVERMRSRESLAAVGSPKAFAGLDIPCLERGYIAVPSSTNATQLEQMVGRFRRAHEGKDAPVVRYYWDEFLYPSALKQIRKEYGARVSVRGA